MGKRIYLEKPIFDIPRIPENEELFKSILDEEDTEKREGQLLFDAQEDDAESDA